MGEGGPQPPPLLKKTRFGDHGAAAAMVAGHGGRTGQAGRGGRGGLDRGSVAAAKNRGRFGRPGPAPDRNRKKPKMAAFGELSWYIVR